MALTKVGPAMLRTGDGWAAYLDADAPRVYPEEFGCVADDDSEDNATNLQLAFAASAARKVPLWIGNGKSYYFGTRLTWVQGMSIEGDGTGWLVQLSGSGKFDNTLQSSYVTRNGADACGILIDQITSPILRGVNFSYQDSVQSRWVKPVTFARSTNVLFANCEITGYTSGELVCVASCTGRFLGNYVHDCEMGGVVAATDSQLTAFGIDNDQLGPDPSDIEIAYNRIWNMTTSAAHAALYQTETDGINVIKVGSKVWAHHNDIRNCGEGIDSFGQGVYEDNVIKNCKVFGFKAIHGFNNAIVRNNSIEVGTDGGTGLTVWATDVAGGGTAQHISDVQVYGNIITKVPSGIDGGIVLVAGVGTYGFRDVTVYDNIVSCEGAQYGIKLSGTNTNQTARLSRNRILNAVTNELDVSASAESYWLYGDTVTQEFASSGTATKPFGANRCQVRLWGSGGGGGGGSRQASGTAGSGGGGGGGGGFCEAWFDAKDIAVAATITVAAGGTSGAGATSNGTDGSNGGAGGLTQFSDGVSIVCRARGGGRGAAGRTGTNNTGGGAGGDEFDQGGDASGASGGAGSFGGNGGGGAAGSNGVNRGGGAGGGGGVHSAAGSAGGTSLTAAAGGGAGGGVATSPVNTAGGAGGRVPSLYTAPAGGTGAAGTAGTRAPDGGGTGGGGGGSNASGAGYAGGAGGAGGGGGGGGGAGISGNGGAGGVGGAGYAIVTWYM